MAAAFVQAWTGVSFSNSTGGSTGAITTTAGNTLVVVTTCDLASVTVSDSKGNTWLTADGPANNGGDNTKVHYVLSCLGGASHTITIAHANGFSVICAAEYSGIASLDAHNITGTGNSTTLLSSTATTSVDNCMIIGGGNISAGTNNAFTGAGGLTVRSSIGTGSTSATGFLGDKLATTAGGYTASATWSGSAGVWICAIATFAPTGGAPAGQVTPAPARPGVAPGGFVGVMAFQWQQIFGNEGISAPAAAEIVAQVATLSLTAIAIVPSADAVAVTAQVSTLTLTAVPVVPSAGAATVTAQVATLALTALANTPSAGAVTITAQVATVNLTAVANVPTAGAVAITAQVATLTLTAVPGVVTSGVEKVAQVATLTLTAVPVVPSAGAVSITAQIATITFMAVPNALSGGAGVITAQIATLTLTGLQGTFSYGAVTKTAQIATVTLTAVPGTVTAGALSKTAQIATVTLTALQGTVTVGAATVAAQPATLTLTALQGTLTAGGSSTIAQPAVLTLTAIPGVIFAGTIVVVVGTVLYGQDPAVIRGRDTASSTTNDPGVIVGRDAAPIYGQDPRVPQGA